MLTIDGSQGEGGGQVLRSALGLSLATGTPFRIENIRAGRKKPGLMRQHLTSVEAAARISNAELRGAALGSKEIMFTPGKVVAGEYRFAVGTAGSTTLVLQTILPGLMSAAGPSTLTLEGGTHNPMAPPFDFLVKAFLPLLGRMGPKVGVSLERHGFYPAGGGRIRVDIAPAPLAPLQLLERGEIRRRAARAVVSALPDRVARRELDRVREKTGWEEAGFSMEQVPDPRGPGNALVIEIESANVTEVFTSFGERGVKSESVADDAIDQMRRYLTGGIPVGEYLADQLLLPIALAGRGAFRTLPLSRHATTNIEIVRRFVDRKICAERESENVCLVRIE
jgi:RNA 3'-terminal phosphate cyclase (ATP)